MGLVDMLYIREHDPASATPISKPKEFNMLKISVRFLPMAMLVVVLWGCQKPGNLDPAGNAVEPFNHEKGTCPMLPPGTYFIAGIPEQQRESIMVGTDNELGNSVFLTIEGRSFRTRPTGSLECKDYGVSTEDRLCFIGGCNGGAFVVSYAGVASGKSVKGRTAIKPLSGNSLAVSQNRSDQNPRTLEYRKM